VFAVVRERALAIDPWWVSAAFHGTLALLVLPLFIHRVSRERDLEIAVIESPKAAPEPVRITRPKPAPPRSRQVFGASRRAMTAPEGEEVKQGNTVAKVPDNDKLRPSDADSLPIPAEEYLVTRMPKLSADFRVPYPPESRKAGVQGAVVMDLLIDEKGGVREAKLVEAPNAELGDAALGAARKLVFEPAMIETKAVAVRIRYAYRFVLER
jgi:protein TonB